MINERDIENLLEQQLTKNDWVINVNDPSRNVYPQKPRTAHEQQQLQGLAPDFCLYLSDASPCPEIVIETKKPKMNLAKTKAQALNYANILGAKIAILFDGLQTKHYWAANGKELTEDGIEVTAIRGADFYQKYILQNTSDCANNEIVVRSKEELINVFAFANQKLRKAGVTKGMERFFEFSNLLFLKLVSESNDIISNIIPQHIKWEAYKNKTGSELLSYINDIVIPTLERVFNNQGETTLFTRLIIKDTIALKHIIDRLDRINLSGIKTDIKGDAFEYFIKQYNSTNNDLGEYFTPRHIVNFLVKMANPIYGEKIYDPFCGTGGMLIAAFNHIKDTLARSNYLTDTLLKDIKENTVYGSEISSNARIAKMNMILTGDGHSNIKQQDTLLNPIQGRFDVVITNIPFNLEGTAQNLYPLLNGNGNSQSIQHIAGALNAKATARAYVIVPEAVLNNDELKTLRKYLIDNNLLKQIISLPSGVFLPYTEAKASILVLQGFNGAPVPKIKYTIIKDDGFTLTQRRRKIAGRVNDLEEYLFDNSFATKEIERQQILGHPKHSFIWFKYFSNVPQNYVLLKEILKEERIKNTALHETATVTKHSFWGILSGEEYWGSSFASVTSENNENYKVVNHKSIVYSTARANVGSIGINIGGKLFAVSTACTTCRVADNRFLPEYVFLYLRSRDGVQNIRERAFGSVRQTLRFEDLCTIAIPCLPKERQQTMVDEAYRIHSLYLQYVRSKEKLEDFDID